MSNRVVALNSFVPLARKVVSILLLWQKICFSSVFSISQTPGNGNIRAAETADFFLRKKMQPPLQADVSIREAGEAHSETGR